MAKGYLLLKAVKTLLGRVTRGNLIFTADTRKTNHQLSTIHTITRSNYYHDGGQLRVHWYDTRAKAKKADETLTCSQGSVQWVMPWPATFERRCLLLEHSLCTTFIEHPRIVLQRNSNLPVPFRLLKPPKKPPPTLVSSSQ